MPSQFSRIRVEDLLNDAPSRGKSSHRPGPSTSTIFDIKCGISNCNRTFASTSALEAHQRRSHAAPTCFACKKCNSSYSTAANLNKHVRSVHGKVKPFKCGQCGASFGFRDGLFRHTRMVHQQVRPHFCTHCSLKFKTKAHLTNHSLAIHPEAHRRSPSSGTSSTPSSSSHF